MTAGRSRLGKEGSEGEEGVSDRSSTIKGSEASSSTALDLGPRAASEKKK